jgi:hypothetical protein
MPRYLLSRTTLMSKAGFGQFLIVSCWWWPWRVSALWISPEVDGAGWTRVPFEVGDEVVAADSWEQAMAVVRRAGA